MSTKGLEMRFKVRASPLRKWNIRSRPILLCLCLLACGPPGHGKPESRVIQMSVSDTSHTEFYATFEFGNLPSPLRECAVRLTLQVNPPDSDEVINHDVTFSIWGTDERLQLVDDTVFTWPGPICPGQIITHEFGFVPRMSGTSWVIVSPGRRTVGGVPIGPRFAFNLDESGTLCYLGSPQDGQVSGCDKVTTYFLSFGMNSLTMAQPDKQTWQARFTPLPRAGDTCHVQYDIVTPIDWPDGATIDIHADGFAVVTLPQPAAQRRSAGDSLHLELTAVADSVPGSKELRVQLIPELADHESSVFNMIQTRLCFWFDDGSNLQYAALYPIKATPVSPRSCPETTLRATLERYRLEPDGEIPIRFGSARRASEDSSTMRR